MRWYRTIPFLGRLLRRPQPTPDDVRDFWDAAHKRWGSARIDKRSSRDMELVGELLGLLGIIRPREFMERYATTLGNRIYAPFEPGEETDGQPLWAQIEVCVHEHVHVVQDRQGGGLLFSWDYITSPAARTRYEVEAMTSALVLNHRYRAIFPSCRRMAETLIHYGCGLVDVEVAEKALLLQIPAIKSGAEPHEVTRWAIRWLDERWSW